MIAFYSGLQESTGSPVKSIDIQTARYESVEEPRKVGSKSKTSLQVQQPQRRNELLKNTQPILVKEKVPAYQYGGAKGHSNRTTMQIKQLQIANSSGTFDSFEQLGFQANLVALTAKNNNTSHVNFNQKAQFKSPERASMISNSQFTRNNIHYDADSLQSRDGKQPKAFNQGHKKIHQKILKLTDQATTFNNQSSGSMVMQNSLSNGNLKKDSSGARLSTQREQILKNQSKLFRPASLKLIMPTIDEQIIRLTAEYELKSKGVVSPSNMGETENTSSIKFFKTLSDNQQQLRSSTVIAHPTSLG